MVRLTRLITLALSFFALQLTLLRGGAACPMPTADAVRTAVGASGADGSSMAGMAMPRSAGDADVVAPGSEPCRESTAPTKCQSLAPCLAAIVVETTAIQLAAAQRQRPLLRALVLEPPSESIQPDLPPPRA